MIISIYWFCLCYALAHAYVNRDLPYETCWDLIVYKGLQLSKSIIFEDHIGVDRLRSNKLIDYQDSKKIMSLRAKWTVEDTYWLLTEVLPWKGNLGFIKFCCLLLAKYNNLPDGAWKVCHDCEEFDFRTCNISQSVVFFVDSSCVSVVIGILDVDILIHMKYLTDTDHDQKISPSQVVHNASIVCVDKNITATLILNIDKKYIDEDAFQRNIARQLKVDRSEVQLVSWKRNSTWMLLRLSVRAGLRLVETFSKEESRNQFGQMIGKTLCANSARNVSIQVKIGDLPPSTIHVTPTGIFPIKFANDTSPLIKFNQRTLGECLML